MARKELQEETKPTNGAMHIGDHQRGQDLTSQTTQKKAKKERKIETKAIRSAIGGEEREGRSSGSSPNQGKWEEGLFRRRRRGVLERGRRLSL